MQPHWQIRQDSFSDISRRHGPALYHLRIGFIAGMDLQAFCNYAHEAATADTVQVAITGFVQQRS